MGDGILITRRGSMLARLEERDIIETGLEENDANVVLASTEINVHRTELAGTSKEVADLLPRWLKGYDIVMLRGNGPFAIGHLLEEAYQLTSVPEMACRITTIADGLGEQVREHQGSDRYEIW